MCFVQVVVLRVQLQTVSENKFLIRKSRCPVCFKSPFHSACTKRKHKQWLHDYSEWTTMLRMAIRLTRALASVRNVVIKANTFLFSMHFLFPSIVLSVWCGFGEWPEAMHACVCVWKWNAIMHRWRAVMSERGVRWWWPQPGAAHRMWE